jgi:hypothetical protein
LIINKTCKLALKKPNGLAQKYFNEQLKKTKLGSETEHKAINSCRMRLLYFDNEPLREILTDLWVDLISDIDFLKKISADPDKLEIYVHTRDRINKETEKTLRLLTLMDNWQPLTDCEMDEHENEHKQTTEIQPKASVADTSYLSLRDESVPR